MSGPNRVVVCVNCDDFINGPDRKMIHGIRYGIVEQRNRSVTYSQLETHKAYYRAHATWSLNLLGTCRHIYHEAVLVPFKKNAFAVVDGITLETTRPLLAIFLNRLVPTQAKAIAHSSCRGAESAVTEDPHSHASRVWDFWRFCSSSKVAGTVFLTLGQNTVRSASQTKSSASSVFRSNAMSRSWLGNTWGDLKVIHLI